MNVQLAKNKITVIGAGISGLTTAYLLLKEGFDVTVLEKRNEPGGSIETMSEKGYLFDRGPNSALETTPIIAQLVDELNLQNELVYANKKGDKRYILRNKQLHALPMSPQGLIKTKLFSTSAKLRLFAEPFIGRSKDGYYQSIAEFVSRRLGQEFLDYAINPFVAGVYAGKPEELSVKSAFPKLYALEEKYGGLIVGTVKSIKERKARAEKSKQSAKMLSFRHGMQVLPEALSNSLGSRVLYHAEVKNIDKAATGYNITYDHAGNSQTIYSDYIISTIPAYTASDLFGKFDEGLPKHLNDIYYPPVLVLYLGYKKEDVGQPLDGFGFLIPAKERRSFLGAIWSSVLFPNRSTDENAAFTLFIGGARNADIVNMDKEILFKKVRKEFELIMKITNEPVYMSYRFWPKAIPQYNIGYIEHERYCDKFEDENKGIYLSGNYRGGISVGDCITSAGKLVEKIIKDIN